MLVSAMVSRTAGWLASTRAVASLFAPLSGSRGLAGYKAPMTPPPDADRMGTADLCDVHLPDPVDVTVPRKVQVCEVGYFNDYGGKKRFWGPVSTVRCFENNPWVRSALEEDGKGRVLVSAPPETVGWGWEPSHRIASRRVGVEPSQIIPSRRRTPAAPPTTTQRGTLRSRINRRRC